MNPTASGPPSTSCLTLCKGTYVVHFVDVFHEDFVVFLDADSHIVGNGLIFVHLPLGLNQGIDPIFLASGFEEGLVFHLEFLKFSFFFGKLFSIIPELFLEHVNLRFKGESYLLFEVGLPADVVFDFHFVQLRIEQNLTSYAASFTA